MAIAYRTEFTSIGGIQWKLEIDDALGVGVVQEFKVDSRGFVLNYQGNEQDIFNPVISSTATFTMLVNSAVLEQFVDTLVSSAEERFRLVAYRDGILFWVGIILNDSVREEDLPYPYGFEIQAVDGLARLNRKEYAFTDPTLHDTFMVHLRRIMLETRTQDLWSGNYMKMVVNWYESSLGTVGTNSLEQVSFANSLFTDIDKSGNVKAKNYLEILQEICKLWGARFFQSGGYYWFVQIGEYDEDNFREWTYDTNLDTPVVTVETQAYELEIDKVNRFKLSAMQKTWLPPLLKSVVNYKHYTNSANALSNFIWKNSEPLHEETVTELVSQTGAGSSTTKIKINALVEYSSDVDEVTVTQNGYPVHKYRWAMRLRVLQDNGNYYYLQRETTDPVIFFTRYGQTTWQLENYSTYEFWSDFVNEGADAKQKQLSFEVETPATFFSGTVLVRFELLEIRDSNNNNLAIPGTHGYVSTHRWKISNFIINISDQGESEEVPSDDLRVYSLNGNAQNSFIKEVDLRFADGPQDNSVSALKINGTNTANWNIDNGSENLKIAELLAKDMLGFQKNPVEVISGGIIAKDLLLNHKIKIGTRLYICMRGSYTANDDEWRGAWLQVDRDTTGTVSEVGSPVDINDNDKPISIDDVTGGGGGGNPPNVDDGENNLDVIVTDLISLTKITQNVIAGNIYTSISVLPVDAFIPSGSSIALVRPDNGLTEIITLTDDYSPNDTTISVNHTFTNSFPANSFVFPDYTTIIDNRNSASKAKTEPVRSVSGATYTINNFDLPNPNDVTAEEINRRLRIERGGLRIYYPLQFTIDVSNGSNNIASVLVPFRGEVMYAELID